MLVNRVAFLRKLRPHLFAAQKTTCPFETRMPWLFHLHGCERPADTVEDLKQKSALAQDHIFASYA